MALDFLGGLRLRNVYGPPSPFSEPDMLQMPDFSQMQGPPGMPEIPFMQPPSTPSGVDIDAEMNNMNLSTNAQDRFNQLMGQYPTQGKPGALRSIAALISGFGQGGAQAGLNVLDAPFQRDVMNWKNQVEPAERAASIERQGNANERTMRIQLISQKLREQADAERTRNNERNAKIKEDRAEVYRLKSLSPNMKVIITKGGTVKLVDPKTGRVRDTGIDAGSMTESDRIALEFQNEMTKETIGAANDVNLENLRQEGRTNAPGAWAVYNVPDGKGGMKAVRINTVTGETIDLGTSGPVQRPGSGTQSQGLSPSQERIQQFNKARELANRRPDLAKYLKIGVPGPSDFFVVPPGSGMFGLATGPTAEQYRDINMYVYGTPTPPMRVPFGPDGQPLGPQSTPDAAASTQPGGGQQVMRRPIRNTTTGEKGFAVSYDGGKTWQREGGG